MTAPKLPFAPSLFHVVDFSGTKAQNAEWLSEDIDYSSENSFPHGRAAVLRLSFALSDAVAVEITRDSGTTWNAISGTAEGENIVDIIIKKNSQVNLRTSDASGVTVTDGIASLALKEG